MKFYRMSIIIEGENEWEAEQFIEKMFDDYSGLFDMWREGDAEQLTKKEIIDFFGYEEWCEED